MRLTRHADYSLRVLTYLALSRGGFGTIQGISEAYGISRNHLMKVVLQLSRKGYIETTRGKGGGLTLRMPPERIRVGQVVRDMEPDLDLVECFGEGGQCVISPACKLKTVLRDALEAFLGVLDEYTVSDLTRDPRPLVKLLSLA